MLADNLEESKAHNLTIHKITEASYFIFEPLLPLSRVIFEGLTLTGTHNFWKSNLMTNMLLVTGNNANLIRSTMKVFPRY